MARRTAVATVHLYGKIVELKTDKSLVKIGIRDACIFAREKDKGIAFIPIGKRRLVVVRNHEILAVYIRPRIKLFLALGRGEDITDEFLVSLRPKYFYRPDMQRKES